MTASHRLALVAALGFFMSACGGGGGGETPPDVTAPPAPVLTSSSPASPSSSLSPTLSGSAEPGASVLLFVGNPCSAATPDVTTSAGPAGAFSAAAVTVPANASTSIFAAARDAAGNTSACSAPFTYVNDALAPAAPLLASTSPASPSSSLSPTLSGSAEPGALVSLFLGSTCSGTPATTTTADAAGAFSTVIAVPANASTALAATATDAAGNRSSCSAPFTYVHDALAPAAPVLASTSPASPSRTSTTPTVSGSAEPAALVSLFLGSACSGTPAATTTADAAGAFSAIVTVPANATSSFVASARDAAGGTSACSNVLTYTHDDLAPAAPALSASSPASPSSSLSPTLSGSAEPGASVLLFVGNPCSAATPDVTTSAGPAGAFSAAAVTVPANASSSIFAAARDAAGNTSACSAPFTYVNDALAPAAPLLASTSPASPSSSLSPTLSGSAEPGALVTVFAAADCSGAALTSLPADPAGAFTTGPLAVAANTTTSLAATATDAAGNRSSCSAPFTYVHDALAPAAPVLASTSPASPSRTSTTPSVSGSAEPAALVSLFFGSACSGTPAATTTADAAGAFSAVVTVPANAASSFVASARDAAGGTSACSNVLTYTHDDLAPAAPALSASSPASPSSSLSPTLSGSAEPGASVLLFVGNPCSAATPDVTTSAGPAGAFSAAAVTVPANASSSIFAAARDAAGNTSPCSAPFTYVNDALAPAAPLLASTSPASPSSSLSPTLSGSAEPGALVSLFLGSTCSGTPATTTTADAAGAFTTVIAVPANASTSLTATATDAAGNRSSCSAPFTYVHDALAPAAPVLASTSPASPSRTSTTPSVSGSAEPAALVSLFFGSACSGTPAATTTADAAGAFSAIVTVPANATSSFVASARDAAGGTSACSNVLTYTHDDLAPAAPALSASSPASPSSSLSPTLSGSAEPGASVLLFVGNPCSAATPDVTTSAGPAGAFSAAAVTVPANASSSIFAAARDAAGNTSACSAPFTYVNDALAPAAPLLASTSPASPSSSLSPTLSGSAEPGALVTVFAAADCSGAALTSLPADPAGAFTTGPLAVAANTTTSLAATATDAAGNRSSCSAPFTYVHDALAPAAPVLTGSTPASGSNDNAPAILGAGEPGARVAIHADPACAGPEAAVATAGADGSFSALVSVADNSTTTFHARQTDAAGNASACSLTSVTYMEESRTLSVTPSTASLDTAPSALSQLPFGYLLSGGPDSGVAWSVLEPGGGSITAGGLYSAPSTPGTYHVVATALGSGPALQASATVVVHHPELAGSVVYTGAAAGRIFLSISGALGGPAVGGTSLAVTGPGTYPWTVRGLPNTGPHRVAAWLDAAGVGAPVPSAEPYGETSVNLLGQTQAVASLTLVDPAALAPPAAAAPAVIPGDGMAIAFLDTPRDPAGRELASAYRLECTTGAPPATPGPAALRIPAGYDSTVFVYGLTNGVTTTCTAWNERGGSLSAPATSATFLPAARVGGFTVGGTLTWSGEPPGGPLFAVLYDASTSRAVLRRYDGPTFPLAFSIPNVPAGQYTLGFIADAGADGRLGPTDLDTLSGVPQRVTVGGNVAGISAAVSWPRATLHAAVARTVPEAGPERWDLLLQAGAAARLPVSAVALQGLGLLAPTDLGASQGGGGGFALTTTGVNGGGAPAAGTYLAEVGYADGTSELLTAAVGPGSLLDPPVPLGPALGAESPSLATFTWAEPLLPPASYAYRVEVFTAAGALLWGTDALAPSQACAAGTCQVAWNFDGRAPSAALAPGAYRWSVELRSASLDSATADATFLVPVEVTVTPASASLLPEAQRAFTASVNGGGLVTWSASCGTLTPRADPMTADFTAPASGPCAVTATSVDDPTRAASAVVTVLPIGVAVAPASATLAPGQVQYLSAAITGPGSVSWSATCGTLGATADPLLVRWDAPATTGACTVQAASTIQPASAATATLTVAAAPQAALAPPVATLNPGQAQPFELLVGGAPTAATFAVTEVGGGAVGADGVYTAPALPGLYHLTAVEVAPPGRTATAVVRVVSAATSPQAAVVISPASATTAPLGQVAFAASVSNCADQAVAWSVREAGGGSVSAAGLYTAPATAGTYHLVATAACDPSKSALATVAVDLPSVSGTVAYGGTRTGRVYLALEDALGRVIGGTSLASPGPFTIRGVQAAGAVTLRAWMDFTLTSKPQRRIHPTGQAAVVLPGGLPVTGVAVTLVDAPAFTPPPAPVVSVAAGADLAIVWWSPSLDPATGAEAAGRYQVTCDTAPVPTAPRTFTVGLADQRLAILVANPGTAWACTVLPSLGAAVGPPGSTGQFDIGPIGGTTVSGTVTEIGIMARRPMLVMATDPATGRTSAVRFAVSTSPQDFTIQGVEDAYYDVGAVMDTTSDGVINRTEPSGLEVRRVWAELAGAAVTGLQLDLAEGTAFAEAVTRRTDGAGGTSHAVMVRVRNGSKVPAAATVVAGAGVTGPIDMGMQLDGSSLAVRLGALVELGAAAPLPGSAYDVQVTYTDGTSEALQAQVSAVLEPPTPLAPLDPLALPIAAPAAPGFTWAPPLLLPAGGHQWAVQVGGAASWRSDRIAASRFSEAYNATGTAVPALLPAGTYPWRATIRDSLGNEATSEAVFTVSP